MIEMPILVQWKWQEKTKTFLVIFHFYDDFSKPNLRLKKRILNGLDTLQTKQFLTYPIAERTRKSSSEWKVEKPILTWAPSHIDLALLSDLLTHANIINGLPEDVKRDLRYDLEIVVDVGKSEFAIDEKRVADIDRRFPNPCTLIGRDRNKEGFFSGSFSIELCPEYINYIKEILKPYLRR
jgi:hypothetical protein